MKRVTGLVAIIGMVAVVGSACADSVVVSYRNANRGGFGAINYKLNGNNGTAGSAGSYTFWLEDPRDDANLAVDTYGVMNYRNTATPIPDASTGVGSRPGVQAERDLFCMQLTEFASSAFIRYDIDNPEVGPNPSNSTFAPIGAAKSDLLARLYGRFHDLATGQAEGVPALGSVISSGGTQLMKTAFQLAVWEIVHETNLTDESDSTQYHVDLNNANDTFFVSAIGGTALDQDIYDLANDWLAGLKDSGKRATGLYALLNPGEPDNPNDIEGRFAQDYLIWTGGSEDVPAPMALIQLIGLGAMGVVALRRRRS